MVNHESISQKNNDQDEWTGMDEQFEDNPNSPDKSIVESNQDRQQYPEEDPQEKQLNQALDDLDNLNVDPKIHDATINEDKGAQDSESN